MKERVDEPEAGQVVVGIDGLNSSLVGRRAAGVPSDLQLTSCPVGPAPMKKWGASGRLRCSS